MANSSNCIRPQSNRKEDVDGMTVDDQKNHTLRPLPTILSIVAPSYPYMLYLEASSGHLKPLIVSSSIAIAWICSMPPKTQMFKSLSQADWSNHWKWTPHKASALSKGAISQSFQNLRALLGSGANQEVVSCLRKCATEDVLCKDRLWPYPHLCPCVLRACMRVCACTAWVLLLMKLLQLFYFCFLAIIRWAASAGFSCCFDLGPKQWK